MGNSGNQEFTSHSIEWSDEKIKRLWDYYGASPAHRSTYFGETVGEHFVRVLKRNVKISSAARILDFSCGTGAIISSILKYAKPGMTILGCDFSEKSVGRTNERNCGKQGFTGASLITGYPSPIASGSVDLLILTEVIEHLDDTSLKSLLGDVYRVLSPSGCLVVTTPNEELLERAYVMCPECGCAFHRWQHRRSWSVDSLRENLERYDFCRINIKPVTWGNEFLDICFSIFRQKKTGLFAVAYKN